MWFFFDKKGILFSEFDSDRNKLTSSTISVGQPTIEFDNDDMGEVFVVNDGYGLLSTIKYKEHEDAASAVDYIKFIIPDDKDFVFSSELADIAGISVSIGDDDIIPVVEGNGKILTVNIPPEYQLSENDEVELGQVKILFSSTHLKKFNCPIVVWILFLLSYGITILSQRQNGSNLFLE